ncbi:PadR family transcriptional regulator [Parvularcula flava]|uniref:PadR family transcriptional regulator n=1 Tax=Aquisalinus luteolus TaxID=1566827 RepID=A0A8J3A4H9_9PROT|nr:PadR family transcriptional regulator [Aquisalinus luteolus]NHK26769.1 PadR family transcriptional regulator [Aquisalinus luteolus]GGH93355.1 hypothetical protein GCM10011355_05000 [Aquisalinus luteolus]
MANYLGEFEIIVLAALVRLGDDAYGVSINDEIESRTGRTSSVGALYTTLSRLSAKGYVRSRLGEATPQRGGRAKKYFEITSEGLASLEQSARVLHGMLGGIAGWPQKAPG